MINAIQVIIVVFALFALSRAYLRYSEGKIKNREFLFWLIIWIAAIVAILYPKTVSFISDFFGIGRPADLILYTAVILLFYLVFRIYVSIDSIQQSITKVVREVAIKREKKK